MLIFNIRFLLWGFSDVFALGSLTLSSILHRPFIDPFIDPSSIHSNMFLSILEHVGFFPTIIVHKMKAAHCPFDCMFDGLFDGLTLHGSAPGGTPAAQNERHAAWEAVVLQKTSATLHGSAPGRPPGATRPPQDHAKTAH